MNTKSKATVATIGLGALVLSGGTLALWRDSKDLSSATINTGRLGVTAGEQSVYDVSELKLPEASESDPKLPFDPDEPPTVVDRSARSGSQRSMGVYPDHVIVLSDFQATPGDTLRVVQAVTVKLEGHNLLARLDITDADDISVLVNSEDDDEFSVDNVRLVTAENAQKAAAPHATLWDQVGTGLEYRFTAKDSSTPLYVVYDVHFDINDQVNPGGGEPAPDAPAMNAEAVISGLDVTLTQIRHADVVEP